jgi:hypothetical protein
VCIWRNRNEREREVKRGNERERERKREKERKTDRDKEKIIEWMYYQHNKDGSVHRIKIICANWLSGTGKCMWERERKWEREKETELRERERKTNWMKYQHDKDGSKHWIRILWDWQCKWIVRNWNEREKGRGRERYK